jgi:hypothetical protein
MLMPTVNQLAEQYCGRPLQHSEFIAKNKHTSPSKETFTFKITYFADQDSWYRWCEFILARLLKYY